MPARPRARRGRSAVSPRPETAETVIAGRAYLNGRFQPVELGIDAEGTIVRVARLVRAERRFDFGDRILLPAATDLHVHLRDPGGPEASESFATGTVQAALGGVGLVADMPNTEPPVTSADRLRSKVERTRRRIAIDVLLYGLVQPGGDLASLAREAGALKLYLSPTTAIPEPPPTAEVHGLLEQVAASGLPLTVHAEDPRLFGAVETARTLAEWNAARPPASERRAVDSLLPGPPGLRLHVAHVTQAEVARRLSEAGHSFEATPHHLLLNDAGDSPGQKVNPPLRSEGDRAALFAAFCEGRIPILASDHAPHPARFKELPFSKAPSGVPGVETMLPLWLEHCRVGAVPLPVLLRAACDRPARWLGVPMGRIAVGHRAHLSVVDFRQRRAIRARELHAPCGWTPFEGRTAIFPRHVFHYGEPIVEDGEFVGPPRGRVVRPEYAPSPRGDVATP